MGEDTAGLPHLSVSLLKSVDSLEGIEWPRGHDALPRNWIVHPQPNFVTVRLPGGGTISSYSTATFFVQRAGIVNGVELMPLRSTAPFQTAIVELEKLLAEWNLKPDDRAKRNIEKWKTYGDVKPDPIFVDYGGYASIPGEERAFISFQLRPKRGKGWFLVIELSLTMDEHRKLWNLPATQSTTADTEKEQKALP